MRAHIIRLDPDSDRELAALAAELRTSEADVVRRAIRELAQRELPAEKKKPQKSARTA